MKHKELDDLHNADAQPVLPANVRARLPYAVKSRVVEKYYQLVADSTVRHPYLATIKWAFGAGWRQRKSYLNKFLKAIGKVYHLILSSRKAGAARRMGRVRPPDWFDEEGELYLRLLHRRTVRGFPCNHFWLISEFQRILDETQPDRPKKKKYTTGWAVGFCKRHRISTQARNNTKEVDQAGRVDAIKTFHRYVHLDLQPSAPQTDPVYGRFAPLRMLHADQVPLAFASPHTRTLNPIGAKSCRIAGVQHLVSTSDKQLCRCGFMLKRAVSG